MPEDFAGNSPASVTIQNGSLDDYFLIEAPDVSCRWNGFPVAITVADVSVADDAAATTRQLSPYLTPTPGGGSPSNAEWPFLYLPALSGGSSFTVTCSFRSDGSGTYRLSNQYNGLIVAHNFTGGGGHSFTDVVSGPDCAQIGCPADPVEFITSWAPFNPLVAITIGNGILTITETGTSLMTCNGFSIVFNAPCGVEDSSMLEPGLLICLATDECAEVSTTWNDIATALNAHPAGFVATVLGGHSGEPAFPDPNCDLFGGLCLLESQGTVCYMDGAICDGGVDSSEEGAG